MLRKQEHDSSSVSMWEVAHFPTCFPTMYSTNNIVSFYRWGRAYIVQLRWRLFSYLSLFFYFWCVFPTMNSKNIKSHVGKQPPKFPSYFPYEKKDQFPSCLPTDEFKNVRVFSRHNQYENLRIIVGKRRKQNRVEGEWS